MLKEHSIYFFYLNSLSHACHEPWEAPSWMGYGLWLSSSPAWGLPRAMPSYLCFVFLCFPHPAHSLSPSSPHSLLLPQVPSAPRRFRVRQPNLEIINLEWDHPEHPNGILIGYSLRYVACTFRLAFSYIIWASEPHSHHFSKGTEVENLRRRGHRGGMEGRGRKGQGRQARPRPCPPDAAPPAGRS